MKSILEVMVADHEKIVKLLHDVRKSVVLDNKILKKSFETFYWELEKHIFTEEKIIFTSYKPEDFNEGYKMVPNLMKEHNIIYKKLNEMRKKINSNKPCDFQEFKDILFKHKCFEEGHLYQKLDQELDLKTKKMMIDRINEFKTTDGSLKKINIKCSECGKKIGIFKGYHHSKLEKRWFFCNECYNKI